jgi:hypothetical protein
MRIPARRLFVPRALWRALALPASLLLHLAGACSSGGARTDEGGPVEKISVSLVGYGPAPFTLVSESHTSRVELYSNERSDAGAKVLGDEVMRALVDHLEELGLDDHGEPGAAPAASGGAAVVKAFNVEDDGERSYWPLTPAAGKAELEDFSTAVKDFLGLYNVTQGWQSVDNTLGGDYFDRKKAGGGR